jgi:hypothetical protein
MSARTVAATLLMTALLSGLPPARVAAQSQAQGGGRQADQAPIERQQNAQDTRERLRELLNEFPPAIGQVLRLDPSLISSAEYLAPYPALATFLKQHPEVARNPSYFLGDLRFPGYEMNNRRQMVSELQDIGIGIGVFLFFMTSLAVVAHIGRGILDHRRWLHATKVQTDAHTKIVDRLGSNEELMTYVQSPAGQRFLSSTNLNVDPESRGLGAPAPIARILSSAQIGVVTAFGGLGLWVAKNYVIEEVAQPLTVLAVLGAALGLGFVLSAGLAYGLSRQLGLIRSSSTHA